MTAVTSNSAEPRWPELRCSDAPTGYGPWMNCTPADIGTYQDEEADAIFVAAAINLSDSGNGSTALTAALDRLDVAMENADGCTDTMEEILAAEAAVLKEFFAVAPQEWRP